MIGINTRRVRATRIAASLVFFMAVSAFVVVQPSTGEASDPFLFGATPESDQAGGRIGGLAEIENQLGRTLGLVRVFERWENNFPSSFHNTVMEEDRLMVVSVRPVRSNGTKIKWRDIANASPGSGLYNDMVRWADRLKDVGDTVWFSFHHEPEAGNHWAYGDSSDFIAAYRKFVDIIRSRGANNVEFAWIMTHWSFETAVSDHRHADKWYPGDAYVDLIGSDAYNWDKCRDSSTDYWRTLQGTIEPQRLFGLNHPDKSSSSPRLPLPSSPAIGVTERPTGLTRPASCSRSRDGSSSLPSRGSTTRTPPTPTASGTWTRVRRG